MDFRINPNTIPVLKRTPVQINVEALKVAGTRGGTLQLILIEKDAANRTNEFVLSTVDIIIRKGEGLILHCLRGVRPVHNMTQDLVSSQSYCVALLHHVINLIFALLEGLYLCPYL